MQRASLVFWLVCAVSVHAQTAPPAAVPISKEAHHHLVLENEYVRVYSVEVPPHEETLIHQHDLDYVFVTLGDSDVENVRVGDKPARLLLKDGEVRFTKGGFAHKAVNKSDKPFRNVTIEILDPNLSADKSCGCSLAIANCPCGSNGGALDGMGYVASVSSQGRTNTMSYTVLPKDRFGGMPEKIRIVESGKGMFVAVSALSMEVQSTGLRIDMKPGDVRWLEKGSIYNVLRADHDFVKFTFLSFTMYQGSAAMHIFFTDLLQNPVAELARFPSRCYIQ